MRIAFFRRTAAGAAAAPKAQPQKGRVMTRHAEISDIPDLKALWAEVFGDEPEYIELFFNKMFRPEDYVVLCGEDGSIISIAALIPVDLVSDGKQYPVSYLYGMATKPSLQGNGYGLQLLDFAAKYCKENGKAGIALQPAGESVLRFYEKAGYKPAFTGVRNPNTFVEYPKSFLDFAKDAGYDVPAQDEPQRSVPGVFLSFVPKLHPQNAYMPYPLD